MSSCLRRNALTKAAVAQNQPAAHFDNSVCCEVKQGREGEL